MTDRRRIGLILTAGGAAWLAAISLDYALQEVACDGSFADREVAGLNLLELIYAAVALAGALVAALAAWQGWRLWRAGDDVPGGNAALGLTGLLLNGMFALLLAYTATGFLFLGPCE